MSHVDRHSAAGDDTLAQILEGQNVSLGDLTGKTVGDFQVERLLGRGGMGEVYLATQLSLNRPVALKVLRSDVMVKPGYRERFESEALAVAKLNHPSIVHVYAMSRIEQVHFIAMEYVEGTNLRDYVVKRGALDLPQAMSIMKQAAQAIGAAGEAGIIHRDVKPENILMTRRGRVKVADFGLCRQMDEEGPHLTQVGITMGTPAYMSPEQAQGYPLDHRSDLYSLGATCYFMLAGMPPFRADSAVALALKHIRELPASLMIHRPDLPLEIDRLVMKLMAKDPADRYQSAAELLADLAKTRVSIQGATAPTDGFEAATARTEEVGATATQGVPAVRTKESATPAPAGGSPGRAGPGREGASRGGDRGPRGSRTPVQRADRHGGGRGGPLPAEPWPAGWPASRISSRSRRSRRTDRRRCGSNPDGRRSPSRPAPRSSSVTPRSSPRGPTGPPPGWPCRGIIPTPRTRSRRPTPSSRGSGTAAATSRR